MPGLNLGTAFETVFLESGRGKRNSRCSVAATVLKITEFEFTLAFFVGVFTSFIVGLFVIKFLMSYLQKGSFKAFAIYRVIFGIVIIVRIITLMV